MLRAGGARRARVASIKQNLESVTGFSKVKAAIGAAAAAPSLSRAAAKAAPDRLQPRLGPINSRRKS
ncbi:hypothetical protein MPC4_230047 [Methylocella tundrae]|uniref:Uncharacterized protein n=1 Tax=Methylocella tundrae TaxID=227605 RepID=A0A8B6M8M3_METTU|nr:hypothetical protein MPC4_230047 [Methylocella tundrae]